MSKIADHYQNRFKSLPTLVGSAPGRVNLIGEHTDYNKGYVLPVGIDRCLDFAFAKTNDDAIQIQSLDLDQSINLKDLQKQNDKTWSNFFIGILLQLKKRGFEIGGFNLVFGGNIPIGGGLSSSSALECGFLKVLNTAYDLGLNNMEMIEISRASNHEFLGLQGGIMDQFSVLHAIPDHAILLNCDSNEYEQIPIDFKDYDLIIIDSKVSHSLIHSGYNDRVNEGKMALAIIQEKFPTIKHLSQVNKSHLRSVKTNISATLYSRVQFIIEENERVHQFCQSMSKGNMTQIGELIFSSHDGLKDLYEVSCDEIDLLVDLASKCDDVLGARMIGGGFGGCTLNLIQAQNAQKTAQKISRSYRSITGIDSEIYPIKISGGAEVYPLINS